MLQLVYGAFGCGKSEWIYRKIVECLQKDQKALLLIPEHQVLLAEEALSRFCKNTKTIGLQVVSFRRLANYVFRTVGGLSYRYIESGAQLLVLYRAVMTCAPYIVEYRNVTLSDPGLLQKLFDMIAECKRSCVAPAQLQEAAREVDGAELRRKLCDFSLIYATYEALLHEEYDDPADDLTRLADVLSENDLFSDTEVFVDAFFGFSVQELHILSALLRQSGALTVSLPMLPEDDSFQYEEMRDTQRILLQMAERANETVAEPIILRTPHRYADAAIPYLCEKLWKNDTQPYTQNTPPICAYIARDSFDEVEFVAQQIQKETRNGVSYREIAVVARDIERYDAVLESVFEAYGIPCFLSKKVSLETHSFLRFVKNLLSVVAHSYQVQDIVACLKSPYLDVPSDDCLLFENYLLLWGIQKSRFTDGIRWNMNPDGYTVTVREDTVERLERIHKIRMQLLTLFTSVEKAFAGEKTVHEVVVSLYSFFTEQLPIFPLLQKQDSENAVLVWNAFVHCLEQIDAVAKDMRVGSIRQFMDVLSLCVSKTSLRNIPVSKDSVVIGDAAQLRVSQCKVAFVLGVNEDAFPKTVSAQGIFTGQERTLLHLCGVTLSDREDLEMARELYYTTRAFSLPSHRLYASCSAMAGSASSVFERMQALFPTLCVYNDQTFPVSERVFSLEGALQSSFLPLEAEQREALVRLIREEPAYRDRMRRYQNGFDLPSFTLNEKTRANLFSRRLFLSQSRLERFLACPFAYHCKYSLGLSARLQEGFHAVDVGNLVHKILEECLQRIFATVKDLEREFPSDTELKALVSAAVQEYVVSVSGENGSFSLRLENLFRRMKRSAFLLLKNLLLEFAQSRFFPAFFELSMTAQDDGKNAKTLSIPLQDGTTVEMIGQIDRVDVYRRGKQIYLRVVDYKTGTKSFQLENIRRGIDLQMLIYLFALWKNPPQVLKKRVAAEQDCEFLPAGVLYFSAKAPLIEGVNGDFGKKEVEYTHSIPRSGILLDDDDVLRAMERDLGGKYIPVTEKSKGSSLVTLEGFGKLYESIQNTVAQIASELRAGVADPTPNEATSSCDYCPYSSICRKTVKK